MTTINPNCGFGTPWWPNPIEPTDGGPTQTNVAPVFRTTPEAVANIIRPKPLKNIDLTDFIAPANSLVTEWCVNQYYAPRYAYPPFRLELIERYLAGHIYLVTYRIAQEKKLGKGEVKYKGKADGIGFNSTELGQMALRLDSNGSLARLDRHANNGVRGIIVFLGTRWYGGEGWGYGWGGPGDAPFGLGDIG